MQKTNITPTSEISSGIINSFIKIAKKTIIFGIIIPGAIYLLIRFLEIAFGFAWKDQFIFQIISYTYGIGYIAFLTYKASISQLHTTVYYSVGWILGLILLLRLGIFSLETFFSFLIIPTIFIIIKFIYLIFRKKKNQNIEKKIKRSYNP